jgi:hypothetical protein
VDPVVVAVVVVLPVDEYGELVEVELVVVG